MNDEELTPDQEERVRRLLSEARHAEPMPAEVVARLDGVLAELSAGRADGDQAPLAAAEPDTTVVSLAARRRLRQGATLLVAAAAVTVIGVAGPSMMSQLNVPHSASSDSDAGGTTSEQFDSAESGGPAKGGDNEGSREPAPGDSADALRGAIRVRPEAFARSARKLAEGDAVALYAATDGFLADCSGAEDWGEAEAVVPAEYAGKLGALIYRTPEADGQRVDLFLCGVDGVVRSTIIPRP